MGFFMGLLYTAFGLCAVLLILIVLIQRGKGGGLAGAFGGMGGHSAFGTRAGDKLMRITIGIAGVWIVLAMLAAGLSGPTAEPTTRFSGRSASEVPAEDDASSNAGTETDDSGGPSLLPEEGVSPDALTEPPAEAEAEAAGTDASAGDSESAADISPPLEEKPEDIPPE